MLSTTSGCALVCCGTVTQKHWKQAVDLFCRKPAVMLGCLHYISMTGLSRWFPISQPSQWYKDFEMLPAIACEVTDGWISGAPIGMVCKSMWFWKDIICSCSVTCHCVFWILQYLVFTYIASFWNYVLAKENQLFKSEGSLSSSFSSRNPSKLWKVPKQTYKNHLKFIKWTKMSFIFGELSSFLYDVLLILPDVSEL